MRVTMSPSHTLFADWTEGCKGLSCKVLLGQSCMHCLVAYVFDMLAGYVWHENEGVQYNISL